jgi:hypothetical protein
MTRARKAIRSEAGDVISFAAGRAAKSDAEIEALTGKQPVSPEMDDGVCAASRPLPKWRLRRKKGRRKPIAEFTCNCGAYPFPHRFGGGACNGGSLVEQWWASGDCGNCGNIAYDSQTFVPYCQVIEGGERLEECGTLQEFMRRNEVRIKGVNWK